MNDKPLCIGLNNLYFINGDASGSIEMISDNSVFQGTTLSEATKEIKDFNKSFSFTIRNPPLKVLRFLGIAPGYKRNPLRAKDLMRYIKHNQI